MPVIFNLDVVMAMRKIKLKDLAARVDITEANLSKLKTGKAKAIKISTLEALCRELDCKPGDIIDFQS
jgi:putative transcriptional regulator